MQYVAVSELRANLMKLLKRIERGDTLIITSRGKVVAKIVPPDDSIKNAEKRLDEIRESAKVYDVLSPIQENWDADDK